MFSFIIFKHKKGALIKTPCVSLGLLADIVNHCATLMFANSDYTPILVTLQPASECLFRLTECSN